MVGLTHHNLDFEIIETGNPKTLVFIDSSEYMEEPDRPLLEVTPPGYNKYLLINIIAKNVNTFNSSNLGINKVLNLNSLIELQDGIWNFKYKICPYDHLYVEKKFFRTVNIMSKVRNLYDNLDLQDSYIKDNKNLHRDLAYLYILIEGARTIVNIDSKKAYDNYHLADRIIDKALNKFCKNC